MSRLEIRPLRMVDLEALEALDFSYDATRQWTPRRQDLRLEWIEEPLRTPFRKEYLLEWPRQPELAFTAWLDGRPAGVAAAWREAWNRRLALDHLYVDRAARGLGAGRALLEAIVAAAPRLDVRGLWLETQTFNLDAIRFYLRCGFSLCGYDESLYDPAGPAGGEIALFLYRPLDPQPGELQP